MIDIYLYRSRIGTHCPIQNKRIRSRNTNKVEARCRADIEMLYLAKSNCIPTLFTVQSVLYLVFILYIAACMLGMTCDCMKYSNLLIHVNLLSPTRSYQHNYMEFVKCFYLIILAAIMRLRHRLYSSEVEHMDFDWMRIFVDKCYKISRLNRVCHGILMWLFILNFLLIAIVNPSLLNPGPTGTGGRYSVLYLNSRGLIPCGELNNQHPTLHTTKIHELNLYIDNHKPEIVILNETWLKPSILDNEVIPTDKYKVFRLDRCNFTHPIKDNGGG